MFGRVTSDKSGKTYQFEYCKAESIVYLQMPNGSWLGVGTHVRGYVDAKSIAQHYVDTQGL
ncbi:MAG: hypothetical protein JEY96_01720 [Bacteroidales bacterium]|nr:hypothetical protein [Bacteroidales bacterium]